MGEFYRPWVKTQRLDLIGPAALALGSADTIEITKSSSVATGMVRSMNIAQTMTADIGNDGQVEVLKAQLNSEVNSGGWAVALSGVINFGTAGYPNGVAAAISGEMIPPNGSLTRGSLYAAEAVFGCQSGSSWGSAGPVAFQKYENYGTKAYFSANAFLWHLIGETPAVGGLISENSNTVRVRVGTGTKYLPFSTVEDTFTFAGDVDITGDVTMTMAGTENLQIVNATLNGGTKGVYIEMEAGNTSIGCRQGALHVELGRSETQIDHDGNPDVAVKITNSDWQDGGTMGRIRGMDIKAQNDGDNGNSTEWINTILATAECATSQANAGDMTVAEFHLKNNGVITGSNVGVIIQDESQGAFGTTYGLIIKSSAYAMTRNAAIQISSLAGSWTAALDINDALTYLVDLDGCDGGNGEITSDSGSECTSWKARIKVKTDDGSDAWINCWTTSNES